MEEKKKFFLIALFDQLHGMPSNFWFACVMEIFERLAFFGSRAVAPLYLVKQANENGLGLGFDEKGHIFAIWALIQCLVPMVSGGYTDRYGFRKSLAIAFVLNVIGYSGMALSLPITLWLVGHGYESPGYWVFLTFACFVGFGTAIFKPAAHGTIAKSTNEENSSVGWGMFYWVVNFGGALAPMIAAEIRGEINWDYVFWFAAAVTAINFLPAFLLFKEPERVPPKEGEEEKGVVGVFVSSISTAVRDVRLLVFLGIFSCFWLMFMQLWDLTPNFIDEWVDTSNIAPAFTFFRDKWVSATGQVKPEMMININPWSIILLVLIVSALIRKINKIAAMVIGMVIAMVGFVGAGLTTLGWFCALMILIFSIGEMTCSPTFQAYIGLIAPKDKKALYMGYSNIPFAIGWAVGNLVGGTLYESMSSKINLARRYMVDHLSMSESSVEAIKDEHLLASLAKTLQPEQAAVFTKLDAEGKYLPETISAIRDATTQVLWDAYHPERVWYYLGAIGLLGTLGMLCFFFLTRKTAGEEPESSEASGS
ncbi:MFS transporter [Myxococcota bacterium]